MNANVTVGNGKVVHSGMFYEGSFIGTTCGAVSFGNCIRGMKSVIRKTDREITCKICKAQLVKS